MLDSKNTLFTIGQFAALHNINKKTLMWYDETELFKPATVGGNGYRYYTCYQSSVLNTILMLRELGVSIPEIKLFLKNRSAPKLERLLEERIQELDKQIFHLKKMRSLMVSRKKEMSEIAQMDMSEISIVERERTPLILVYTSNSMTFEEEMEMVIRELEKRRPEQLYEVSYGSMIAVESLRHGNFEDYFALFIKIPGLAVKESAHVQPKGKYLRAFCKGSWDRIPARYEELLAYAREHQLSLHGYAYEAGVNEIAINTIDEYITQIEIPIAE